MQQSHEVSESEVVVCHHPLDLVKLRQVGGVQGLVAEHSIDGEVLDGSEGLLLPKLVQHAGTHRSGVGAQKVLLSLLDLPVATIAAEEGSNSLVTSLLRREVRNFVNVF